MKSFFAYLLCSLITMIIGYYFSLGMTSLIYNENNASREMAISAMAVFAVLFLVGVVVFATFIILDTIKNNGKE